MENKTVDFDFGEATEMLHKLNVATEDATITCENLVLAMNEVIAEINRHWYTRLWWKVCGWWVGLKEVQ